MRGHIRPRIKGSWQIFYDLRPDGTGKRRQKTETVKGNKKDAERLLRERLACLENGGYVARDKETVAQFLTRWLVTYAATNTTLRTRYGYKGYIRRYIQTTIGGIELQKLTPQQVQGVYARMLGLGLSTTTVVQLHRIIREALSHAVKWGLLVRNVADATSPPSVTRKQLEMWDADMVNRFLGAAQGGRFRDFYYLAILTGMRRSELCGLKWENVDLVAGCLGVVNTLQRITEHGLVEGQPKTARSRRSIALSPQTVNLLHAIRGQQMEQQLAAGEVWHNPQGYVFTQSTGSPVAPDMVSKEFTAIVRRSGLPHLTLHGLRHAHATLLLKRGIHPKVVSERLGHSNIAITMDTYSHVLPGLQEQAALALDDALFQGQPTTTHLGQNANEMLTNTLGLGGPDRTEKGF
jgi:integrase